MLISDVDKVADSFNDCSFLRIIIPAFEVAPLSLSLSQDFSTRLWDLMSSCSDKC